MSVKPSTSTGFSNERTVPRTLTGGTGAKSFALRVQGAESAVALPAVAPHRFTLGKSPACDLPIDDPEVSRRHVALEARANVLLLEDLDSTNGTRVNGVRVREAFLEGGETIRIGATTIGVEVTDRSGSPRGLSAMGFGRVIGASRRMRSLYPFCERLANSKIPVVIEGETGTGKELLAESLHEVGSRCRGPFIIFDCTTVPPNLMEAAIFGHVRGAFTGAESDQPGVFELATGGTLFIDEIGDLQIDLQAKLLRAVDKSEVRRIGGQSAITVDLRIICATRRNLELAIQRGKFRDDLYHRLAVARIELPPLRDREGDVKLLAEVFWSRLGGGEMPSGFVEGLAWRKWPGNVRELHNHVARSIALGDLASPEVVAVRTEDDNDVISAVLNANLPFARARDRVHSEFLRRFVERALAVHGGNARKAATASGISRRYFTMMQGRVRSESGD